MSDNSKALQRSGTNELQMPSQTEWQAIRNDKKAVASRLKLMLFNGKKLSYDQVYALTGYALANDLNPFNHECYPTEFGIIPGIAGWRRKATEQLFIEAQQSGLPGGHFHIDYYPATHDEAQFDETKGDVAWKAVLTDSVTRNRWRRELMEAARQVQELFNDASWMDVMDKARDIVGTQPEWWAVGVVEGSENFGKGKWDRNERCKKRAAKGAIRMRFSGLQLPAMVRDGAADYTDDEPEIYMVDSQAHDVVEDQKQPELFDEEKAMKELGF